ncbi:MAG: glycosyltransferase [Calditrichia bacterium]
MRGGESVLEALCGLFPQADLYTLLHNPGSVSATIESHQIYTSFIDRLPFKASKYRHYLPLFPTAIERFNFKNYQLILSTSHCVAKGIITPPDALHISYLHTPMRYVWDMYEEYFGADKIGFFQRKLIPLFANYLRMWDVTSANRVDWYIANSRHVARRIQKYYNRQATVIHPPVDIQDLSVHEGNEGYDLIVSALVPYKKVDLAISAYNQLGRRLVVVGSGPEKKRLQRLAGKSIEFFDWQSKEILLKFYAGCRALIFPGEEDFGIVPLEAMACGKPVIAYGKGGALETVIGHREGTDAPATGIFFPEQTPASLIDAIHRSEGVEWDSGFIAAHARQFDKQIFLEKISGFIQEKWTQHLNPS